MSDQNQCGGLGNFTDLSLILILERLEIAAIAYSPSPKKDATQTGMKTAKPLSPTRTCVRREALPPTEDRNFGWCLGIAMSTTGYAYAQPRSLTLQSKD